MTRAGRMTRIALVTALLWLPAAGAAGQSAVKSPFDFAFGPQEYGTFCAI